jgi:hypothetical protein
MVIVCAVLFLGLVSGASWKTDAGSVTSAAPPAIKAAVLPAPMTPIEPAPETLPSPWSPPSAVVTPASVQVVQDPSVISVVVEKNATLRHISLVYLDRFDQRTLAAIRVLNPSITDPNRLEAGQQIRLPLGLRRRVSDPVRADSSQSFVVRKLESSSEEHP